MEQVLSWTKPSSGGIDHDNLRFDQSLALSGATAFYALILVKTNISLHDYSSGLLTTTVRFYLSEIIK